MLSVEAVQERRTWLELSALAARSVGTLGAVVSPTPPVPPVSTTSFGAWAPDSRLAMLVAPEEPMVRAMLTGPAPATSGVTSTATQVPAVYGPEAATPAPMAGAFANVMPSAHDASATDHTWNPFEWVAFAHTFSVA